MDKKSQNMDIKYGHKAKTWTEYGHRLKNMDIKSL